MVLEALGQTGAEGFSLFRRFLEVNPGEGRVIARQVASVPWNDRSDLDQRRVSFVFLGSFSTGNLEPSLVTECLRRGIVPLQHHAPFNRLSIEVRDPAGGIYTRRPDVVVLAVDPADRVGTPYGKSARGAGNSFLTALLEDIRILRERYDATILVHNFLPPEFRPHGLREWRLEPGVQEFYAHLNVGLAERVREIPGVYVVDLAHLSALAGCRFSTLHKMRFLGAFRLTKEVAIPLCREYAAVGAALKGLARKCLAVDLDGTLWGGIVGEQGWDHIELGPAYPGNVYRELQDLIRQFHDRGVILVINSHNNEDDAWEPFRRRREMALRPEHFTAWRINWRDKAHNLRELAEELGIGLESVVMLDDDPVDRAWVEETLPEVHVLSAQDPLEMLRTLATCRLFESLEMSPEDRLRNQSYAAATLRREAQAGAADLEAFLAQLELSLTVRRAGGDGLERLAQLTQRTNQFNLTTRRYTEAQIRDLADNGDVEVLFGSCRDRFAEEGITALVILRRTGVEWVVDTFLLSCRVLGRGIERALMSAVYRIVAESGAETLLGEYVRSEKNGQAEWFYRDLGFALVAADETGARWRMPLPAVPDPAPPWIRLTVEQ